jgi:hypothetical protein
MEIKTTEEISNWNKRVWIHYTNYQDIDHEEFKKEIEKKCLIQ